VSDRSETEVRSEELGVLLILDDRNLFLKEEPYTAPNFRTMFGKPSRL
jgi:hypothetical protein